MGKKNKETEEKQNLDEIVAREMRDERNMARKLYKECDWIKRQTFKSPLTPHAA